MVFGIRILIFCIIIYLLFQGNRQSESAIIWFFGEILKIIWEICITLTRIYKVRITWKTSKKNLHSMIFSVLCTKKDNISFSGDFSDRFCLFIFFL